MNTFRLEIVSAEKKIFSGDVQSAHFNGECGEMEILPNHIPFLSGLNGGLISYRLPSGEKEVIYASGGFLEVQPNQVMVLTDTINRADELDEQLIQESMNEQRQLLSSSEVEYSAALSQLAELSAKIRLIQQVRKLKK